MRLQITTDIFDYWNALRGEQDAPLKSQIEPGAIPHLLSSLFILETEADRQIRFRLAGTKICDLFGHDLRGERFSSLWANGHNEDIERTAKGVMDHTIPTLFNATGYSTAGHHAAFEIIVMPLRSHEGGCDRLLGAIAPAVAASWLEIVPLELLALDRSRLLHDKFGRAAQVEPRRPVEVAAEKHPTFGQAVLRVMSHFLHGATAR
ncbi:PAS domain-containing protein [Rhizobium sp. WYJ-E13]|uniref:PAS domain-containing protein n=1 Tax=Rhizobium sp. WYJ-E13 TaxID=2849093 RepID=UPI001C1F1BB2|nr:PAS domain-containing protein [Rhizobium sp. WYJ-E13]QWW69550.1 PAS domain-containing protein [Rhizobium sp. WYJ-E13]